MRFLPPEEPMTLYQTGFSEDDILGRTRIGKTLSEILDRTEDPLVVALDGQWGTGKSHFLKRWVGAHRGQNGGKALTLYFDAFSHDYLSDPLAALVGVLSERMPAAEKPKMKRIQEVAFKFVKPLSRVGLALATAGVSEIVGDVADAGIEALKGQADKAIDSFWEREGGRRRAMDEFHSALVSLTTPSGESEIVPLVFVVDELDRCRPDFALDLMETIKHFFAVPHVHFVFGVNLEALQNSVRARYGSGINASQYLGKFISFTMELPEDIGDPVKTPAIFKFARHYAQTIQLPNQLMTALIRQIAILDRTNDISIRDVEKILSSAALLPTAVLQGRFNAGYEAILVTLLISRVIKPDFFRTLVGSAATATELGHFIGTSPASRDHRHKTVQWMSDYDFQAELLFQMWDYVCSNGKSVDADGRYKAAEMFGVYRRPSNPTGIPKFLYDDALSFIRTT